MKIQTNQSTSSSNVNFGVRAVLNKRFYRNPDKTPKALKEIIDTVEEQTKDIPGTLNLRNYFHSQHDIDWDTRNTIAFYEHGKYKDGVVLYESEKLNLYDCKDEKLVKILVSLAKIFQSREKALEEILPLQNMIKNLQDEIKTKTKSLETTLKEHYKNMGLSKSYDLAQFGGESDIRSYLFLGDINLYKVSEVCKRDMAEQERYLKQIDNPPVG